MNGFFRRVLGGCTFLLLLASAGHLPALSAQQRDLHDEERRIASELRCVVCQNLSVADSPSEMAQQMRAIVSEQLQQGKTPDEIKAYFVSKYGEWVLLSPPARGFSLLVWLLPFVALGLGMLAAGYFVRRWARTKRSADPAAKSGLIQQLRQEATGESQASGKSGEASFRETLLSEQARLRSEIQEIEFDYQTGKLSGKDREDLRRNLDLQQIAVEEELNSFLPQPSHAARRSSDETPPSAAEPITGTRRARVPVWQLAAGGLFLLVIGITLGMFLTKSLRPRLSEQDSITGDFLTGTNLSDVSSLLARGRDAFDRQEWGAAIETFKQVLKTDPNQPEANSYMGLILAQAGHVDESLVAFDRVLAAHPNFPIALWGKGMLLYRAKEDYAGALELFEQLAGLMPDGEEKNAVQKILAEVTTRGGTGKNTPTPSLAPKGGQDIQGTISLGPKLGGHPPGPAVLFIIARSAAAPGPPVAVKKIERPAFPLRYVLGPQDSMIPGRNLTGRVFVSARLDQDGNPATRGAGDWTGEFGKNPVEVGADRVDITIDRPASP